MKFVFREQWTLQTPKRTPKRLPAAARNPEVHFRLIFCSSQCFYTQSTNTDAPVHQCKLMEMKTATAPPPSSNTLILPKSLPNVLPDRLMLVPRNFSVPPSYVWFFTRYSVSFSSADFTASDCNPCSPDCPYCNARVLLCTPYVLVMLIVSQWCLLLSPLMQRPGSLICMLHLCC